MLNSFCDARNPYGELNGKTERRNYAPVVTGGPGSASLDNAAPESSPQAPNSYYNPYIGSFYNYYHQNGNANYNFHFGGNAAAAYNGQKSSPYGQSYNAPAAAPTSSVLKCCDPRCQARCQAGHSAYTAAVVAAAAAPPAPKVPARRGRKPKSYEPVKLSTPYVPPPFRNDLNRQYEYQRQEIPTSAMPTATAVAPTPGTNYRTPYWNPQYQYYGDAGRVHGVKGGLNSNDKDAYYQQQYQQPYYPQNSYIPQTPSTYAPPSPKRTKPAAVAVEASGNVIKKSNLDVREFLSTWDDVEEDKPEDPVIVLDCTSLDADALAKVKEKLGNGYGTNATPVDGFPNNGATVVKVVETPDATVQELRNFRYLPPDMERPSASYATTALQALLKSRRASAEAAKLDTTKFDARGYPYGSFWLQQQQQQQQQQQHQQQQHQQHQQQQQQQHLQQPQQLPVQQYEEFVPKNDISSIPTTAAADEFYKQETMRKPAFDSIDPNAKKDAYDPDFVSSTTYAPLHSVETQKEETHAWAKKVLDEFALNFAYKRSHEEAEAVAKEDFSRKECSAPTSNSSIQTPSASPDQPGNHQQGMVIRNDLTLNDVYEEENLFDFHHQQNGIRNCGGEKKENSTKGLDFWQEDVYTQPLNLAMKGYGNVGSEPDAVVTNGIHPERNNFEGDFGFLDLPSDRFEASKGGGCLGKECSRVKSTEPDSAISVITETAVALKESQQCFQQQNEINNNDVGSGGIVAERKDIEKCDVIHVDEKVDERDGEDKSGDVAIPDKKEGENMSGEKEFDLENPANPVDVENPAKEEDDDVEVIDTANDEIGLEFGIVQSEAEVPKIPVETPTNVEETIADNCNSNEIPIIELSEEEEEEENEDTRVINLSEEEGSVIVISEDEMECAGVSLQSDDGSGVGEYCEIICNQIENEINLNEVEIETHEESNVADVQESGKDEESFDENGLEGEQGAECEEIRLEEECGKTVRESEAIPADLNGTSEDIFEELEVSGEEEDISGEAGDVSGELNDIYENAEIKLGVASKEIDDIVGELEVSEEAGGVSEVTNNISEKAEDISEDQNATGDVRFPPECSEFDVAISDDYIPDIPVEDIPLPEDITMPNVADIPLPDVANIPLPDVANIPLPDVANIPLPKTEYIPPPPPELEIIPPTKDIPEDEKVDDSGSGESDEGFSGELDFPATPFPEGEEEWMEIASDEESKKRRDDNGLMKDAEVCDSGEDMEETATAVVEMDKAWQNAEAEGKDNCQCLIISDEKAAICARCSAMTAEEGNCVEEYIDQNVAFTPERREAGNHAAGGDDEDAGWTSKGSPMKVHLPWNRIFDLNEESPELELGPASVGIRERGGDKAWKLGKASKRKGGSAGEPVLKVKRLVLQQRQLRNSSKEKSAVREENGGREDDDRGEKLAETDDLRISVEERLEILKNDSSTVNLPVSKNLDGVPAILARDLSQDAAAAVHICEDECCCNDDDGSPRFKKQLRPRIKSELHHCLLCHRSFGEERSHAQHVNGKLHRLMELMQRKTIHTMYRHFTGLHCPHLEPLTPAEKKKLKWRPNNSKFRHFYHEKTPLQIAMQKIVSSEKAASAGNCDEEIDEGQSE